MSAIENIRKVSLFEKATEKKRRVIAAETKSEGVHITPAVEKRIGLYFWAHRNLDTQRHWTLS